jgi:hypothetical protein
MDNKKQMNIKNKKSFAMFITMFLVFLFSLFSYKIVETNIFSSNLNKLKYLHLQAEIHLAYIKEYISTHNDLQINNLKLNDKRYILTISKKDDNKTVIYYIKLHTTDDTPIGLSDKVTKTN